jgi:hypothetical protein
MCSGRRGGGRDGVPRPFGYRAVMIACACAHDRSDAAGPVHRQRKAPPALIGVAREFSGALLPWIINHGGGAKVRSLTLPLASIARAAHLSLGRVLHRFGFARVPHASAAILVSAFVLHGPSLDSGAGASSMAPVDGDTASAERVGEWRAVGTSRRRPIPDVDGPAGVGQGAQPSTRLRRHLHPSS